MTFSNWSADNCHLVGAVGIVWIVPKIDDFAGNKPCNCWWSVSGSLLVLLAIELTWRKDKINLA